MAAAPAKEVTTAAIAAVQFSFYTDQEVRDLSVKRITSPLVYDNLKNAVTNGLYDPALGPTEPHDTCATCGLRSLHCPGHFGHVELAVPVFNPLVFPMMFKLLRCTCLSCFHLKMDPTALARFRHRLFLLMQGRLVDAAGSAGSVSKMVRSKAAQMEGEEDDFDVGGGDPLLKGSTATGLGNAAAAAAAIGSKLLADDQGDASELGEAKLTSHSLEAIRNCTNEFIKSMPLKICAHCGANNPTIKREGSAKVFQMPLTTAALTKNLVQGSVIRPIVIPADGTSDLQHSAPVLQAELAAGLVAGQEQEAAAATQAPIKVATRPRFMTPAEVREALRRMWSHHADILSLVFAAGTPGIGIPLTEATSPATMFFLQTVAVPPNRFRPASKMGDLAFEHPQNVVLGQLIAANLELEALAGDQDLGLVGGPLAAEARLARTLRLWLELQACVSGFIDSTAADKDVMGIRQQLEKKEGLFRKNMMGKRVNFACRSVISPDPYIGTGEIGVPPYFAKRLSFPERVTRWNAEQLAAAVRAGHDALPGAVAVEDEHGRMLSLVNMPAEKRDAVAKQLLARATASSTASGSTGKGIGKIVYRTLKDGDVMLTNRQPTLHKPGMMAHRARILKGERTIRMHYANCATFNADFDGDEINLHLPQDLLGQAEGIGIVHADEQYIVPTDGKPIRGLIQDHIGAGVLMTKRDTFFTRSQFMQLLYAACCPSRPRTDSVDNLHIPAPALIVPSKLYTGKQLLSAVVRHFTKGMAPVSMGAKARTPAEAWGSTSGEAFFEFHNGDLVTGILDKSQFGNYGLVHSVQELYGNKAAGRLLSGFSRLFTHFLHGHGFTCGIDDVLLSPAAEAARAKQMRGAEKTALVASARVAGLPEIKEGDEYGNDTAAVVQTALEGRYLDNPQMGAMHDNAACSALNPFASNVVKSCLPGGEQKPFRHNQMAIMTSTGAKGSGVNFSQISCLLGQQELEGRRVPRMASGKTLPCFAPFDGGARSCGFVGDRFLDGLRPQEYYFHCMAGREGLVDTTVKTSRSGYLQRCLVKNLEALHVHYDATVRDDTDGSIVQFHYGEDGLDVLATGFLKKFGFQVSNAERFAQQLGFDEAAAASIRLGVADKEAAVHRIARRRQTLRRAASQATGPAVAKEKLQATRPVADMAAAGLLGVTSEAFADALADYVEFNPEGLLTDKGRKRKAGSDSGAVAAGGVGDSGGAAVDPTSKRGFQRLMELKYARAAVAPGEAVGVLAAQSVGEPSTQMTLNTFHMAGRGEANVTLGIPRLRELLMTAAQSIKTPVMNLPLRDPTLANAQQLTSRLRRISLAECLTGLSVAEALRVGSPTLPGAQREYTITATVPPPSQYSASTEVSFEAVVHTFTSALVPRVQQAVKQAMKRAQTVLPVESMNKSRLGDEEGAQPGPAADEAEQDNPAPARTSEKEEEDENAEADGDMEEGKLQWAGGRREAATYDDGELEDQLIASANREAALHEAGIQDEEDDGEEGLAGDSTEDGAPNAAPQDGPHATKRRGSDPAGSTVTVDKKVGVLQFQLRVPLHAPKVLMLDLVEKAAVAVLVRHTPGIVKATVVEPDHAPLGVEAQGINFPGIWHHQDLVDIDAVTTNDVGAVGRSLGVEAARAALLAEVTRVFGVYGIAVDKRHLSLLADFMTHQGGYRACSRLGIDSNASPFLKITFETATAFLTEAVLRGSQDHLTSPAAALVMGQVVRSGTGSMGLLLSLAS
eukprot:CAMPEP_0206143018 /NCGR_PEP_ID=MMETSP1473-20131121/19032_1 /ASSEMBLY_ACC=CAM_ASM_001109 /TAXON_ID=1461547 /ORGANISM="Stichococcus sp, Strain RCC1054" /LENGTH=1731 /DNA_ID=CAMNT_0053538243 /DNA_START=203 /DNA_END=5398 /DNA_ORIENTATION=-